MQREHSKPAMEISSVSLARRSFLAGSAAMAVSIGAATVAEASAPATDNHDELTWMIDEYREVLGNCNAAINAIDALDMHPDRPGLPHVLLSDLIGDDHTDEYYRHYPFVVFKGAFAFKHMHSFFEEQIAMAVNRAKIDPRCEGWPMVKSQDYQKAISEMNRQLLEHQQWHEGHGYDLAAAHAEKLQSNLIEVETRIFALPCRSARDIALKIDFVEEVLSGGVSADQDDLGLILRSMKEFVNCCPAAATGQHVPDRARA